MPLVRWGVRKGLNTYPVGSVPEEVKTGLLAPENRPCGLRQVTQNSNVDSLALQLALVLGAWMLAYYAVEAVATRVPSSIGGTMWGLFFPDQYGIRDADPLRDAEARHRPSHRPATP